MSKQKITKDLNLTQEAATRAGAWVLAGLALIGATELILEHQTALNPSAGHGSTSISELFSRGEGRGESARMPEEFDIGMQTTPVSGI